MFKSHKIKTFINTALIVLALLPFTVSAKGQFGNEYTTGIDAAILANAPEIEAAIAELTGKSNQNELSTIGVLNSFTGQNIISKVVSAPVVGNGLVADEPFEINIIFKPGLDPSRFGQQIPAGGRMEIELGGSITRTADVPVLAPNANVVLTTGPQNPIVSTAGAGTQHGNWSLTDDGDRLITITPNGGAGDNGLENSRASEIGFKVAHIRPNPRTGGPAPYMNGPAGSFGSIKVRVYNANGDVVDSGRKYVRFRSSVGRQVHLTNGGLTTGSQGSPNTTTAELVESTLYQRVAPGTALTNTSKVVPFSAGAPYAPRFLMFEDVNVSGTSFIPQAGIAGVDYVNLNDRVALLQENGATIGIIFMTGPRGVDRGRILPSNGPTPALSGNGSILNVPVQVGSRKGVYRVIVKFFRGGRAVNKIIVE